MNNEPINVAVVTCLHERIEISRIFFRGIDWINNNLQGKVQLQVFAAISAGVPQMRALAEKHCKAFWEVPNNPLGNKWNNAMACALTDPNWHMALIMGDDDLIHPDEVMKLVNAQIDGYQHVGFNDCFFIDADHMHVSHYSYATDGRQHKLFGCGTMISREAISQTATRVACDIVRPFTMLGKKYWPRERAFFHPSTAQYLHMMKQVQLDEKPAIMVRLWDVDLESGLDWSREMNLAAYGHIPIALNDPEGKRTRMVDIKTSDNIWSYAHRSEQGTWARTEDAIGWLPNNLQEAIKRLHKKDVAASIRAI